MEGLCRFASVAMTFALVVMQFELSDNVSPPQSTVAFVISRVFLTACLQLQVYLIAVLLIVPSVGALGYATYPLRESDPSIHSPAPPACFGSNFCRLTSSRANSMP